MARTRDRQSATASRRGLLFVAAVLASIGLATTALAERDAVPMPVPRPSSAKSATTVPTAGASTATRDQERSGREADANPLLKGANSPFAAPASEGSVADDLSTSIDKGGPVEADGSVETDDQPLGGSGDGPDEPLDLGTPATEPDVGPPADVRPGSFTLEARLTADGPPLRDGVKWRIFGDTPGSGGGLPLFSEASGGVIYLRLEPGTYYVHVAFGRAGLTRKIEVTGPTGGEVLVLNAGGMRLLAVNGTDEILPAGEVAFDVYAHGEGGSDERFLLVVDSPPGRVIGLNAGVYHVVGRYGDANAIVRADIRIDAGKLTEATVYQKAARLTLKLVETRGGEALADTAWSVVTPAGESVMESVGAFPSVVLVAGDYTAIAKHNNRVYESNFKVETGVHRDVEVLVK